MTSPLASETATPERWQETQPAAHSFCFVCGGSNHMGLGLKPCVQPDGSVTAIFLGNGALEGYPGLLHGGIIASLLDGMMTNCLFAQGRRAVTAELVVRYHAGVTATTMVSLRAWLVQETRGVYHLRAELTQDGQVKVSATAKFMTPHE